MFNPHYTSVYAPDATFTEHIRLDPCLKKIDDLHNFRSIYFYMHLNDDLYLTLSCPHRKS